MKLCHKFILEKGLNPRVLRGGAKCCRIFLNLLATTPLKPLVRFEWNLVTMITLNLYLKKVWPLPPSPQGTEVRGKIVLNLLMTSPLKPLESFNESWLQWSLSGGDQNLYLKRVSRWQWSLLKHVQKAWCSARWPLRPLCLLLYLPCSTCSSWGVQCLYSGQVIPQT